MNAFGIIIPQILTLCEEHNWEDLDIFASERKSPIGWEPFFELAKKNHAPREVQSRWVGLPPCTPNATFLYSSLFFIAVTMTYF